MDHGSSSILLVVDGLVYAAHGLSHFNDSLIQQIRQQCVSTPGNELRGITNLATQLLVSFSFVNLAVVIYSFCKYLRLQLIMNYISVYSIDSQFTTND